MFKYVLIFFKDKYAGGQYALLDAKPLKPPWFYHEFFHVKIQWKCPLLCHDNTIKKPMRKHWNLMAE